ncbi:MAG: hypothetical protein ACPGPE_09640 [Planctomycetota bacterium]
MASSTVMAGTASSGSAMKALKRPAFRKWYWSNSSQEARLSRHPNSRGSRGQVGLFPALGLLPERVEGEGEQDRDDDHAALLEH